MKKKSRPKIGIYVKKNKKGEQHKSMLVSCFTMVDGKQTAVCQFAKDKKEMSAWSNNEWLPEAKLIPFDQLRADGYRWGYPTIIVDAVPSESPTDLKKRGRRLDSRIAEYSEILKNDLDGDFGPLLNLMVFKLRRMGKCIGDNNHVEKASKIAKQMIRTADLLDKVHNDDYHKIAFAMINAKWGETQFYAGEDVSGMGGTQMITWREHETFENTEEIRQECGKAYDQEHLLKMRDLKKALNLMYRNILTWWD